MQRQQQELQSGCPLLRLPRGHAGLRRRNVPASHPEAAVAAATYACSRPSPAQTAQLMTLAAKFRGRASTVRACSHASAGTGAHFQIDAALVISISPKCITNLPQMEGRGRGGGETVAGLRLDKRQQWLASRPMSVPC